jgi:uncharacterized damage-inducible protein DinB
MQKSSYHNRRNFIRTSASISAGVAALSLFPQQACSRYNASEEINVIGPKEGFSPHIGTIVSMMNWMRQSIIASVANINKDQLDYLHDSKSNSIGAMLLHLAATEHYYQLNTFENKKWGSWDNTIRKQWDIPMRLGDEARKTIKGNTLNYYLDILRETREKTITELKKRDDKWLMQVDKGWAWGPTNNYCKWFHVCEHESNHNGQIKWIRSRLAGNAKDSG